MLNGKNDSEATIECCFRKDGRSMMASRWKKQKTPGRRKVARTTLEMAMKTGACFATASRGLQPTTKNRRSPMRVTSSPASAAAFIEFARIEAISLLTASAHSCAHLALCVKRTMDGAEIDSCIAQAVAIRAAEIETRRRRDWSERQASAALFVAG
jgi:hypothetical protein